MAATPPAAPSYWVLHYQPGHAYGRAGLQLVQPSRGRGAADVAEVLAGASHEFLSFCRRHRSLLKGPLAVLADATPIDVLPADTSLE